MRIVSTPAVAAASAFVFWSVLTCCCQSLQAQSITNFLGKGYDGKPMMKNINEHGASFNHIETFPSHFFNDDAKDDDGGVEYVAPKYMLDLYRKFEEDRYSTPMANIVRSFVNIHTGETNANRINA